MEQMKQRLLQTDSPRKKYAGEECLNFTRGVLGSILAILAIITVIALGANLDAANFPGANLKLVEYTKEGGDYVDEDRAGQYVQKIDGFLVMTEGCTNFVEGNTGLTDALGTCKSSTDTAATNVNIPDWRGWVVAPDCKRTNNLSVCAPFRTSGPLSVLGQLVFTILAIQTILFGTHTCVVAVAQIREKSDKVVGIKQVMRLMLAAEFKTKAILGLTITWLIIGASLFVASVAAWSAFCDKIDTGLGRQIVVDETHIPACASTGCVMSYASFFATFVFAIAWYRIPCIVQWFGVLEAA